MPFPSEHAARLKDPGQFDPKSFRRVNGKFGPGIDVIFGKLKGGDSMVIQTIRFDAKKFTPAQVRTWLKDHKYSASVEAAKPAGNPFAKQAKKELAASIAVAVATPFVQPRTGSLFITTTKEGQTRWTTLSSSAFRDRDQEIVSTKALLADVERADHDHDYGPLRFWHLVVKDKHGHPVGADIGDCDFNMMHGHILIESGTFRDPFIAETVKENAPKLEVSIGFVHPAADPDTDGVYHRIRRFERSLVPKGRVANRTTRLII